MRNSAWILVLMFVGCQKEPGLSVKPGQLFGTWNSKATSTSEKPYTRWTFEADHVHTVEDTLRTCQPINNSSTYRYWTEADFMVMRYEGITNGFILIPDIRRRIISITATEVVLDVPRQVLEKCP